jgi:hypothetical protein
MISRRRLPAWLLGVASSLAAPPVEANDDLEVLASGCRQAREAIRTLTVEFEIRPGNEDKSKSPKQLGDAIQRVKWVQSDKTARWRFSSDFANVRNEYLWKADTLKLISSSGSGRDEVSSGLLTPQPKLESQVTSPWLYALFVSIERPHDPIDEALKSSQYRIALSEVLREGRREKHVTFSDVSGAVRKELWIAPELNYLVTKAVHRLAPDGSSRLERTTSEFREVKPGVFFPTRGEMQGYKQGKRYIANSIAFTKVSVNDPIDPNDLELRFPEGLPVADNIKNTLYTVDRNEKPVSGSSALIPLSRDEQVRIAALQPWYRRWQSWALITGLFVTLGLLAAVWKSRGRTTGAAHA